MGLDNMLYMRNKKDGFTAIQSKELTKILSKLVVGYLVTDMGYQNSFRGKVYAEYVDYVSGKSLYDSEQFTEQDYKDIVSKMEADIEARVAWDKVNTKVTAGYKNAYGHIFPVEQLCDLLELFKYCLVQKQKYGKDFVMDAWY